MISKNLETKCDECKHSFYQAMLAASIISNYSSVVQIHIPTTSDKTWVQALIAQYLISQSKNVLIIVTDQILKQQVQRNLITLGPGLQIEIILEFYQSKHSHQITFGNEYDFTLKNYPFSTNEEKLQDFGTQQLLIATYLVLPVIKDL